MNKLSCKTIGDAWVRSCRLIFQKGEPQKDGEKDIRELLNFMLKIERPSMDDSIIEKHGDRQMISWMMSNFLEQKRVPELKNALSYGTRLFSYNGKNQIQWVVQKLKEKMESKAATIPLIIPNEDSGYIPCVSMLDFKVRDNKLMLTAMCRSIDFGNKVYANMLALHRIQKTVSDELNVTPGPIMMYIVSAHIYADDYERIRQMVGGNKA